MPGLERVPPNLTVKTFPVVERRRWVFVWMGDPSKADESLLPDNFSNEHPDWCNKPGYLHYDVPYLLICDNLLDFSHLSYVHANTLGGSPAIAQVRPKVERVMASGDRHVGVRVSRVVPNVPPSPYWKSFRDGLADRYERWFVYDFVLPGTLLMDSGGHPQEAPDDDARTVRMHSCQTLTPETESSTHYFFQQSCQRRDFERSPQTVDRMYQTLVTAFNEDRDMISAQYRALQETPDLPMRPLPMDAALGHLPQHGAALGRPRARRAGLTRRCARGRSPPAPRGIASPAAIAAFQISNRARLRFQAAGASLGSAHPFAFLKHMFSSLVSRRSSLLALALAAFTAGAAAKDVTPAQRQLRPHARALRRLQQGLRGPLEGQDR